ncbi:hypothetical protein UA08_04606 [Talaromyces atroroseus]|uniref:Xylanolytic transcriptional activator regulatory domain-containing protein n=1 Tax=Talaromyces atroroseus TaxID=1441469 RepID=A0A225APA6_TALAT|nr:hypothetical protein UA08_04606 [Talaromyces atroroseus]OKL60204.1 hypothetical protein UA08_04606 [Talaromyces atroroseus]
MPAQFTVRVFFLFLFFPLFYKHLDARPIYYPQNDIEETAQPHKDELINAYFEIVHISFPIVSRSEFDPQLASTLCLASMYALSHVFCPEAKSIDPWVFLNFLGRAIPLEARNASLDSIEAALLYSQRHTYIFRAPTMPGLMAEIGNLVGMAHDVGLNVDPTNWKIPESEKKRRKRLWWGIYMQDKWSALTLGRPSYLHGDQHNVPMMTMADFDDFKFQAHSTSSPNSESRKEYVSKRMFIAMADLTVMLSDVLSTFYTVRAVQMLKNMSTKEKDVCILSFTDRLDQWHSVYGFLFHENQDLFPDPTGTLQLGYYTLEIALCRAVLRDKYDHPIRERGEKVVLLVIELLRTLQISRLRAFWWAASKVNFSIVGAFMFSMLLTSIEDQEIDSWMSRISVYLKLLKEHSINFDTTKLACIRLELLSKVDNLMEDGGSGRATEPITSSDVNGFVAGMTVPSESTDDTNDESQGQTQLEDEHTIYSVDDPFEFMPFDPFGDSENFDWGALMEA